MSKKYNVVVSDAEGNVLFLEQVEVPTADPTVHILTPVEQQRQARTALLDVADSVRLGVL